MKGGENKFVQTKQQAHWKNLRFLLWGEGGRKNLLLWD